MAAYATFPGLEVRKADLILSQGVHPSSCMLTAIVNHYPATIGDLVIGDDSGGSFTLRDCAINNIPTTEFKAWRGQRLHLVLNDRRWRWQYVQISGRFNVPCPDGTVESYANYKDIIEFILGELGEANYVLELPSPIPVAPYVNWEGASAVAELSWLLDHIGCVLTLGIDDVVRITRIGDGVVYPPNGRERVPVVNTMVSDQPFEIAIRYAPTVYDMLVKLEAVGLDRAEGRDSEGDIDLDILPIDELSYAVDWTVEAPGWFNGVSNRQDRELAERSIYRYYRISALDDGTLQLPDGVTLESIFSILPLRPALLKHEDESTDNYEHAFIRPRILGRFHWGDMTGLNSGTGTTLGYDSWSEYKGDYRVDLERGIVVFPEMLYKVGEDGHQLPAELYLACSFSVRETTDQGRLAYVYKKETGLTNDSRAGTFQVEQLDIRRKIIQSYSEDERTDHTDNKSELDDEGDILADAAIRHKDWGFQAYVEWDGIVYYSPTGNIASMRWVVGEGFCRTYGAAGKDPGVLLPSYTERRIREMNDENPGTFVRMVEGRP